MSRSLKAALLSGLVLPGAGQLLLKRYWRGAILIAATLVALFVLVSIAWDQALQIVDGIGSGALHAGMSVQELAAGTEASPAAAPAGTVLLLCWLYGIVDACRPGGDGTAGGK